MAQSILLPAPALLNYEPSSPDPTPLRMIAFSVAEAALMPDPNSPSFGMITTDEPSNLDWVGPWNQPEKVQVGRHGRQVWDVVEKAKDRRGRQKG